MEKTTVYLPDDVRLALKELARRSGRPQEELIREAITVYVSGQERPKPKTFGIVSRADVQGADIEDWLAENWTPD